MLNKYSFSPHNRLRDKQAFSRVFNANKKIRGKYGVLRFTSNNLDHSRIGVISSKKNVRLAVSRNLIRRIIREEFRHHKDKLIGFDLVFVVYREASSAARQDIHQCLSKLFNRLTHSSPKY